MGIEQTPDLQSETGLSAKVMGLNSVLQECLPPTASALWDVRRDDRNRLLAVLTIRDPWGSAAAEFAPDELANESTANGRFRELVGELVYSARRERIEIRDAFATAQQIVQLQQSINAIPNIVLKKPRLFNRVQLSPQQSDRFLITDFAIEVDADAAQQVKEAVRQSGFNLRGDPLLERHGMRDRVTALVARHRREPHQSPRHAVCFALQDPVDLHLLEISDDAVTAGDGSLEGVGYVAGDTLPRGRSIVLHMATPEDVRLALQRNPAHPAIRGLLTNDCWFVYPDDGGESFRKEFPEFLEARRELARA